MSVNAIILFFGLKTRAVLRLEWPYFFLARDRQTSDHLPMSSR